jgi:hypothetical protein
VVTVPVYAPARALAGRATVRVGLYDAVLLPLAKVPAATGATAVMLVAPSEVGVTVPVDPVASPELYDTPVETEPPAPTNVVEAADMIQPAVLPRVSLTPTTPSEPETEGAPGEPLVRAADPAGVTSREPPARVKVAVVSPVPAAMAEPTGPTVRIVPATATVPMMRRVFMSLLSSFLWGRSSSLNLETVRSGGLPHALRDEEPVRSPADPEGPVALRPRLSSGLPFRAGAGHPVRCHKPGKVHARLCQQRGRIRHAN